jgi:hypothetical protein
MKNGNAKEHGKQRKEKERVKKTRRRKERMRKERMTQEVVTFTNPDAFTTDGYSISSVSTLSWDERCFPERELEYNGCGMTLNLKL